MCVYVYKSDRIVSRCLNIFHHLTVVFSGLLDFFVFPQFSRQLCCFFIFGLLPK